MPSEPSKATIQSSKGVFWAQQSDHPIFEVPSEQSKVTIQFLKVSSESIKATIQFLKCLLSPAQRQPSFWQPRWVSDIHPEGSNGHDRVIGSGIIRLLLINSKTSAQWRSSVATSKPFAQEISTCFSFRFTKPNAATKRHCARMICKSKCCRKAIVSENAIQ